MRHLKTSEAARQLNVSANTLRAWETRFGFPKPQWTLGKHRRYMHRDVAALQDALHQGLSISSAVSLAQEGLSGHQGSLITALAHYDRAGADSAIEAALGLRSVERAVEEVLLPALQQIIREHTVDSSAWAFAAHWGADWLRRATRLAAPTARPLSILLGDASRDELDPDAPHIRALELFCVRAGMKLMSLSARGAAGIGDAFAVHHPDLVLLAGGHLADNMVARWTHSVRLAAGPMPIALYRRADHLAWMPTTGTNVLPASATLAQQRLVELLETEQARRTMPSSPAAFHSSALTANQQAAAV